MVKGFPDTWLSELKSKNDIITTLSRYTTLQSKGKNFWACCPFHHEKTPSFCVNGLEQFYHCFGCKEHGDVITFVQKIESVDFWRACEILAKNAGMEMPEITGDENIAQKKQQKDTILKILDCCYKHYEQNLYLKTSTEAQNYIKKRKLTKRELDKFHIGYSVSWTEMLDYLKKQGFSYEDMKLAGIAESKDNRYYDVMGERLIFPIFNIHEECIGFSARSLVQTSYAKYKNSANNIIFDKSKNLYGINELRKQKQTGKLDYAVLVEGQMDVIAMHKAGFSNAIGCLGTGFTNEHCRLLKNITENVVICLDGDSAGQKATIRTIDVLNEFGGFNIKAVKLPLSKDPDEYLNEHSKEELKNLLDNGTNWVEFKINNKLEQYDLEKKEEKVKFVNSALSIINELKTGSEKQVYLDIVKKLSGIPLDVLKNDLNKSVLPNNSNTVVEQADISFGEDAEIKAIKFILASLCYKKEYANFKFDLKKYLVNNSFVKLYNLLFEYHQRDEKFLITYLYNIFDMDKEPNILDIINYDFTNISTPQRYYDECVWKIRENYLKNECTKLTESFKKSTNQNERYDLMKKLNDINIKLKKKCLED